MKYDIRREANYCLLRLTGLIVREEGALPTEVIEAVASQMPADLMLDLSGATYIDSSGLEWLTEIRQTVIGAGHAVTTINASPLCAEIIRLTRLDQTLGLAAAMPQHARAAQ